MTTTTDPADTAAAQHYDQAAIEADATVPAIHIWRDFAATPAQLFRAHTDPDLFARWSGPSSVGAEITEWDARDGGAWRYTARGIDGRDDFETTFRGCFHTVREDRLVQTFTWEGMPDEVALEVLRLVDGARSVRDIAEALATRFAAPREEIEADIAEMLRDLAERGVVVA